jgi:serine/threonine protein kinase
MKEEDELKFEINLEIENMSFLLDNFDEKKVVKEKERTIERQETVSRIEFLQETINTSENNLNKSQDPNMLKSARLFEILKMLEAIEINLKVASKLENRVNKICSIYFDEYTGLMGLEDNKLLDDFQLMDKYISNIETYNYVKVDTPGLFISSEISKDGDLNKEIQRMEFLIQALPTVLTQKYSEHLIKEGSWAKVFALPDDPNGDQIKKVVKMMDFNSVYAHQLATKISDEVPLIDILFFAAMSKKRYFQRLFKSVKINADLSQYKVILNNNMTMNDPDNNYDSVGFYGCLNVKTQNNLKGDNLPQVLKSLKEFFGDQMDDPSNVRELTYLDLVKIINNQMIMDDLDDNPDYQEPQPTTEEKHQVIETFLKGMDISMHYIYFNVFERYDSDLFSDQFQKIYFLQMNSFEIRMNFYQTILAKLIEIHKKGMNHCDVRMTNLLYKITPMNEFYYIDYKNIRFNDFTNVKYHTRFCQGGTIGYLAPEVEHSLTLPLQDDKFMLLIAQSIGSVNDKEYDALDFSNYSKFQVSLVSGFGIKIPEDYVDLRVFFDDVSIAPPDSIKEWVRLFGLLSPIFVEMNLIEKINYTPDPNDVNVLSSKLQIKKKFKKVINFDPSAKVNVDMLKNKFSKFMATKPSSLTKSKDSLPSAIQTPKSNNRIVLEFRGLDQKSNPDAGQKEKFQKRFTARRWMLEGSMNYPSLLIAPLNKADVFSLGILFTEIETAINSNSIFKTFASIPVEEFTKKKMESVLHEGIRDTFEMKINRGLSNDLKEKVKHFFKSDRDAKISQSQYSSQMLSVRGTHQNEFKKIMEEMRDLLLRMTSYYPYDRPDLNEIGEVFESFDLRLKKIYEANRAYKNKMDAVQSTIKRTESTLFEMMYRNIYGIEKNMLLLI